jgi:hypothetical protein
MSRRITVLCGQALVLLEQTTGFGAPVAEREVVGTWRVDTNLLYGATMPTNFSRFGLTLQADHTFVAANVPANFFFHYDPTSEVDQARGTWKLTPEWKDGADHIELEFETAPGPGYWGGIVSGMWDRHTSLFPRATLNTH